MEKNNNLPVEYSSQPQRDSRDLVWAYQRRNVGTYTPAGTLDMSQIKYHAEGLAESLTATNFHYFGLMQQLSNIPGFNAQQCVTNGTARFIYTRVATLAPDGNVPPTSAVHASSDKLRKTALEEIEECMRGVWDK